MSSHHQLWTSKWSKTYIIWWSNLEKKHFSILHLSQILVGHTNDTQAHLTPSPPQRRASPPCEFGQGGVIQHRRQVNQTLHRHLFGGIQTHGHFLVNPRRKGGLKMVTPQNDRFWCGKYGKMIGKPRDFEVACFQTKPHGRSCWFPLPMLPFPKPKKSWSCTSLRLATSQAFTWNSKSKSCNFSHMLLRSSPELEQFDKTPGGWSG